MGHVRFLTKKIENPFLVEERIQLRVSEGITVSDWAENNRVLTPLTSALPGPWRNSLAPYLKQPMDDFTLENIEQIVFCTCVQIGKTEAIINCLLYALDLDQGPCLIVYPTKDLADYTARHRIRESIRACKSFRTMSAFDERMDENRILEFSLRGMLITFVGANSATNLSARPIRYLFMDEVDKYPAYLSREASPVKLAMDRTTTFWNRKIFVVSTPTITEGAIWHFLNGCDAIYQYTVPCPYCGYMQPLTFDSIKWGATRDPETVELTSYYECIKCQGTIRDNLKGNMIRGGRWTQQVNESRAPIPRERARKLGYHINALYSPFLTWGEIAREFIEVKDYPELLRNFVNSYLAMPWIDPQEKIDIKSLMDDTLYKHCEVPDEALFLTAGLDVHKESLHVVLRAWNVDLESWLVWFDHIEIPETHSLSEAKWLVDMFSASFKCQNNPDKQHALSIMCLDSGYRTDEVYTFCRSFPERARPIKGASTRMRVPYQATKVDREAMPGKAVGGLRLYLIDTTFFKNTIHSRRRQAEGTKGRWHIPWNAPEEYLEQIDSEEKISERDRKTGIVNEIWKATRGRKNHYWDAEVYAFVAAQMCVAENFIYLPKTIRNQQEQKRKEHRKTMLQWAGIDLEGYWR